MTTTTTDDTSETDQHRLNDVQRRIRNILVAHPASTWTLEESQIVLAALSEIVRATSTTSGSHGPFAPPAMTATPPTELLQARAVDIVRELLRRGVEVDEIFGRLDVSSLNEVLSLLDNELLRRRVGKDEVS